MGRGYQTKIHAVGGLEKLANEVQALSELKDSVRTGIDQFNGVRVTRNELVRDFGFTPSGLRLLEKTKLLSRDRIASKFLTYDLGEALRVQVEFPGLAQADTIRTIRKHSNITTVLKESVQRKIAG